MSFGGDIKPLVPGNPLKISLSVIGDFLVNWVIPGKTIKKKHKKNTQKETNKKRILHDNLRTVPYWISKVGPDSFGSYVLQR